MATRMRANNPKGVFRGEIVDRDTSTVVVDIARAGILPSQVCYDTLNSVLNPEVVRQDHLIMARTVDADSQVTGAAISGSKIGGTVEGRFVLFPDPMGATGNSLATAMRAYSSGEHVHLIMPEPTEHLFASCFGNWYGKNSTQARRRTMFRYSSAESFFSPSPRSLSALNDCPVK